MPSVAEHQQKAESNLRLFEKLLAEGECCWAVTVLFYAAVHLGRGAAVAKGFGPFTSHYDFEARLSRDLKVPGHVWNAYRELKDEAESARYDVRTFQPADVTRLRTLRFAVFETWARNQMKPSGTT